MNSIFRFDFRHFRGDLFGGITACIVALPLALAFGVSSNSFYSFYLGNTFRQSSLFRSIGFICPQGHYYRSRTEKESSLAGGSRSTT